MKYKIIFWGVWELMQTFYGVNVDDRLGPLATNSSGNILAMAIQKHDTSAVSDAGKINIYIVRYIKFIFIKIK